MIIDPQTKERNCGHCTAPVITRVRSPMGLVELGWNCTCRFTGWDSGRLEAAHVHYRDHLLDAFKRGIDADANDTKEWFRS